MEEEVYYFKTLREAVAKMIETRRERVGCIIFDVEYHEPEYVKLRILESPSP